MPPVELNWLAIVVAAAVHFLLGGLWYGLLLAKPWMRAMGWAPGREMTQEEKRRAPPGYAMSLVGAFIAATVLSMTLDWIGERRVLNGALLGLMYSLAFHVAFAAPNSWFENRPPALLAINASYNALGMALMGGILAAWQ